MAVERLLFAALALLGGGDRSPGADELKQRQKQKDELIASLYELQRRVRNGELPSEQELGLGRVSRERILAGLDARAARQLGITPAELKNRLIPGFAAELDELVKRQPTHDLAPGAEPSPLLTLVLDVEQQLFASADRRRQRAGIKSPIDSGPLAQTLAAPQAPSAETGPSPATTAAQAPAAGPSPKIDAAAKGADPRAVGKALYRAGRFPDALKAWESVRFDDPATSLELQYMHADALFRADRAEEAIKVWEKLASDHPDTSFGQQADFALKIARAFVALKAARALESPAPGEAKPADVKAPAGAKEGKGRSP
jgi:tetratricopeptide (TPR) repeat protein